MVGDGKTNPMDNAFPCQYIWQDHAEQGLTKRELFAIQIFSTRIDLTYDKKHYKDWARRSLEAADALIEQLQVPTGSEGEKK